MRSRSPLLFALSAGMLVALATAPAQAASNRFVAGPLPVDITSELVVSVVNTCATSADVRIVIKNAANGAVLGRKHVTIPGKRGAFRTYHSDTLSLELIVANIVVTCQDATAQRAAPPRPLIGVTVRDWETKVPRFIGTSHEGTGI
jgi:hypothetical protein